MKDKISTLILQAAEAAFKKGRLPSNRFSAFKIEEEQQEQKIDRHGEFSCNIALVNASVMKMSPKRIAEVIIEHMADEEGLFSRVAVAGPGFINFFIRPSAWVPTLHAVHKQDDRYGFSDFGQGKSVQVEFVSANPTGPLHVGHGRGAAVGDSLARILTACGYRVVKEYYINDSGRQIHTLGLSVFLRYRRFFADDVVFPDTCYQGDYIKSIANTLVDEKGKDLLDQTEEEAVSFCASYAADFILKGIKQDLASFQVIHDQWFSEQGLFDSGKVNEALDYFQKKRLIYKKDGALWFKTSDFGDEKDRVVVRENGLTTYFASDIAYHKNKFERGFEKVIDVWGADHHGYIPRVVASIEASGIEKNRFHVVLVRLVNLLREGEPAAMSTRSGEFVTLKDVIDEVGSDAARFLFLTRHYESPLDFDLELAKQKTNDNPVFYVQYVHARITRMLEKADALGIKPLPMDDRSLNRLIEPEEINLIKSLARYPEIVRSSAELMEPHRITFYLMDLAALFHGYYNKHRVLTDEAVLTKSRLYLVFAILKVVRNGLSLLGVSAPEKM